jgi:signal transduction histidine kinase/CheY-like chemotaxis protein
MYPAGVQQRFPEDRMLAEKGIEGYGGQPLQDSSGRSMGLLTVLSRRPLQRVDELESILKIFAIRAATELERTRAMRAQAALEDQLRQVQKMETIGQLAGGVAHDFNNLLSPILGYADLLLDDLPPGDHRAASLRTIKDAAERAAALTRQLLTFSRRQVLDVRVFDLNEAVAGFEAILRRTIREDIDIRFRYHPAPAFIRGDVSQFEQILMNLVVNARDAMPAGGEIVIETGEAAPSGSREEAAAGQPGRLITLTVADSGSGMTPEVLQHVFEPFFTTKEKGRGTGLGLSTVYGIVSQHRGSITIDSQPGAGTRVAIQLPAADPATADTVGAQASAAAAPEPADETIVVVEDDETVRRLVCAVLRHRGYQVVDFPGPRECLDQGIEAASGAALLLTDIIMPGLNGRQLYERLKPHCPALRVLYMSGYAHSVTADRAVGDDGAIDLLPKPFTVDGLVQRVRQAIQRPELPHGAPRLLKG